MMISYNFGLAHIGPAHILQHPQLEEFALAWVSDLLRRELLYYYNVHTSITHNVFVQKHVLVSAQNLVSERLRGDCCAALV
jgi:hypothetical protein